ncbi:MAG: glycoside hydrolase family 32 protein [Actinomycetales bacterium]
MTGIAAEASVVAAPARPWVHYTADRGWMNDPHGVVWHEGSYHVFYQCVPDSVTWSSACLWGHAVSPDLVHWRALPPALTPGPDERGCWSGAAVVTDDGEIDVFYTRVQEDDLGQGTVVRARPDPDGRRWASDPGEPIVTAPADLGAHSFRDPCIFRFEDHWVMVVGAGFRDGRGGLVQFVSPDLETWTYTGVAASRASTETEPAWTGAMWECPQLFEVDGIWVLLVSVWEDDTLYHVAAATGSYDGRTFVPARWQQLTFGSSAYAMTSFVDRDGRRCVMSWLREAPDFEPGRAVRAGAHSLSYLLTVDPSGRVQLSLHPDAELLRDDRLPAARRDEAHVLVADRAVDMEVRVGPGPVGLVISVCDRHLLEVPITVSSRVVLDRDIVEICGSDSLAVHRLAVHRLGVPEADVTLRVVGAADVRAWALLSPWATA